jgi:hypothetical protein
MAVVGLIAAQLGLGIAQVEAWLPAAVLLPATAVGLWWSGRLRVAVAQLPVVPPDGTEAEGEEPTLIVDDARLPLRHVADAIPLDAAGQRELLGPAADPLAFVVRRPWIKGAVQVVLEDPIDPTPYWLVSATDPERLAAAISRSGAADPASGSRAG